MSDISSQLPDNNSDLELRANKLHKMVIVITLAASGMLLHYLFLLDRYALSQLWAPLGAMATMFIFGAIGLVLNRRGQTGTAARFIIAGTRIVALLFAITLQNSGFVLGIAATIVGVQLAVQILPREEMNRVIAAAVVVGVATVVLDRLWPGNRQFIAEDRLFIPMVSAAVVLTLGYAFVHQYENYPIRIKLMTATFAMAAIAIGLTLYFANRTTREILIQNVGDELNHVSSSQASAVGELLGRQTAVVELLSRNQVLQTRLRLANAVYPDDPAKSRAQIEQMERSWNEASDSDRLIQGHLTNDAAMELKGFQAAFPSHLAVLVVDRHGALQAATGRITKYSQASETWWQETHDGGQGTVYIGTPEFNENFDGYVMEVAAPVIDLVTSQVIGAVHSTYSAADLFDLLGASADLEHNTTHTELLLPTNQLLAYTEQQIRDIPSETLAELQRQTSQGERFSEFAFDGVPSLISQAPVNTLGRIPAVDSLGWRIVTHEDRAISLAAAQRQQQTLIMLGMAVLLVTSAAAAIVSQTLTGPITRLTQAVARVEAGDLFTRVSEEAEDEIGQLARAFNNMASQLQETLLSLERRVADRTHALLTSAKVSRSLSTILDHERLVSEVVEQVRSALGYYHAHIYLVDESRGDLVMAAGTGETGREMLRQGHRIARDKGLVGRAATENSVVFVPDVAEARDWLPNPLLPDTKAEVAMPISIGEQILGVLDVQHNVSGGLTQEDVQLLQSISNQVAIALRNARLYRQAQQQASRQATINKITQMIRSADKPEDVLQIAAQELRLALGARHSSAQIRLGDKGSNGQK